MTISLIDNPTQNSIWQALRNQENLNIYIISFKMAFCGNIVQKKSQTEIKVSAQLHYCEPSI